MHFIPGLRLRATEEAEILGIDDAEMGEFAYDYVGLEAELLPKEQRHDGTVGGGREPAHAGVVGVGGVSRESTDSPREK